MRLAEALAERADLQRRLEQLRDRITANARYQEGEEPAEDSSALLREAEVGFARLRELIRRINLTNSRLDLGEDGTMTDALAARDVLRARHALLVAAAAAASGAGTTAFRQIRSELRQVSALPVAEVRAKADAVAQELRELDNRIQQASWTSDLEGEDGSR